MPGWVQSGMETYTQRLSPEIAFKLTEVSAITRNRSMSLEKVKVQEGDRILNAIGDGCYVAALDVKGKQWDTEEFSAFLDKCRSSVRRLVFLVGGADGLSEACLQRADQVLSLSKLTFPHMMIRVLLAEQLYRGVSILRNHPYHRV